MPEDLATQEEPFPWEKAPAEEKVAETPSQKVVVPAPRKLQTIESGQVALQSLDDQLAFAKTLIDQRMVSKSFETPAQVVIGIQYLKEINLPVVSGLRLLYVVNSRPCLFSEGPLMLVQRSKAFKSIQEFFFDENGEQICFEKKNLKAKVFGALTRVWRQGDENPQEDYFTLDDLEVAKLDVGKHGPKEVWVKWQRLMMRYKARSPALKSKFADVIGGVPIAEYDEDFSPEVQEVAPRRDIAQELNDKFLLDKKLAQVVEQQK